MLHGYDLLRLLQDLYCHNIASKGNGMGYIITFQPTSKDSASTEKRLESESKNGYNVMQ